MITNGNHFLGKGFKIGRQVNLTYRLHRERHRVSSSKMDFQVMRFELKHRKEIIQFVCPHKAAVCHVR